MAVELFLKYKDANNVRRAVKVDATPFAIGRGADCELQIVDNALSRKHAEITRFADVFVVADQNSSNGSELNGAALNAPAALKNGDELVLGNAVEINVEIVGETVAARNTGKNQDAAFAASAGSGASWKWIFVVAPVLGVVVLALAIGLLFVLSGENRARTVAQVEPDSSEIETPRVSQKNDSADDETDETENTNKSGASNRRSQNQNANDDTSQTNSLAPTETNNELDQTERRALQFLRSASSDSNPVLTGKQVEIINAKIKSLKNSAAVRENVKAAQSNPAFDKIGAEHNLKPALLRAAALAKLNDSRGDAAATANSIATDLNRYAIVLGTELANDSLLTVAAFAEGEQPNQVRDRLANLAKNTPNSSAAIVRTIWFLKDNNKLSPPAFDFVVRFIALGAMLQEDGK